MSPPIPRTEPANLNAGDTARWIKSLADHPASDGWQLTYTLLNATGKISFNATAQDDDHLVNVPVAITGAWPAGSYTWRATASKDGDVFTVGSGQTTVHPSFAAGMGDARSQARRTLDAIEATLEGRASSATAEYEIAGRKLKYIPLPELLQLRDRLRRDVRSEDAAATMAAGHGNPGRIFVRFGA